MKYPIGIQTFENIRTEGYAYVDKTALVYKLATEGKYYFLSRPRRFGKSLLLSTLKAYFQGKKGLFDGLAIANLETDWKEYPIFHFDFNTGLYTNIEGLGSTMDYQLLKLEQRFGIDKAGFSLSDRFRELISRAYEQTGQKVVILVDEYDKPLLETIGNLELQNEYRKILKSFYGVEKTMDSYIQFAFITGVTKFSKVSIFSDLNNLKDISLSNQYAEICGVSEQEIRDNFDEVVAEMAVANEISKEECYAQLEKQYDGYHFSEHSVGMYNPFSLLNAFDSKAFRDFWFATGTPTFLVEVLQHNDYPLDRLTTEEVDVRTMDSVDMMYNNPIPLLFQSGYLTIKDFDKEFKSYRLGFPNEEVERGFAQFLGTYYFSGGMNGSFTINNFVRDVRNGDVEGFMTRLQALFADGDYQVMGEMEVYFQNTLSVIFKLMGFYVQVERHTSRGRMDVTIQTRDYVYIMELKVDKTADEALKQIEDNQYAAPFAADPRKLFKVGIRFGSKSKGIDEWKVVG
ncbi:MAG: AAA family ATPase [Bacteroidales bacterium]|nr:AAA family ATPase [Bacteroidales bacterium]